MNGRYILVGQTPVPCADLLMWGAWMETADRHVDRAMVAGYEVSTVFLGLDHNFLGRGEPLLFETMIFLEASFRLQREAGESLEDFTTRQREIEETGDERLIDWTRRCSTWLEAELQHEEAVNLAEGVLGIKRTPKPDPTTKEIKHC